MNNVSCRRDMNEVLFKEAQKKKTPIQSINSPATTSLKSYLMHKCQPQK